MRRLLFVPAALLMTFALVGSVFAGNAHQVGSTSVTLSGNTLTIGASIAGLGNVPDAEFSLVGTVDVSSRCFTRKGNTPQAANKQETIEVNSTETFPVRNGRTNVEFEVSAVSTLQCPGGQRVGIESFTYDLQIVGEGVVIDVPS